MDGDEPISMPLISIKADNKSFFKGWFMFRWTWVIANDVEFPKHYNQKTKYVKAVCTAQQAITPSKRFGTL
jgi:hypothetical protein